MAIKAKELQEFRPTVRYMDGDGITLMSIKEALAKAGENYGIPMAFAKEEISNGLFGEKLPCIVMYHPEHPSDYFNFCIQKHTQGKIAMVSVSLCGSSKQMQKDNIAHNRTGALPAALLGGGLGIGYAVGASLTKAFGSMGRSKAKLEVEKSWYGAITGIFDEVIS